MKSKPWWEYPHGAEGAHDFSSSWAEIGMGHKALTEGGKLIEWRRGASLRDGYTVEALIAELRAAVPGLKITSECVPSTVGGEDSWTLTDPDSFIYLSHSRRSRDTSVSMYLTNSEVFPTLLDIFQDYLLNRQNQGRIFVVTMVDNDPELMELPDVKESFEPGNYSPTVIEHYRHIVKDLNTKRPCGRVVILDGPPGTGKTHMVQALLGEVESGTFILVPSNMVSTLGSPNFISVLLRQRSEGTPIVLVIEDGDECLSSRKADNISEVSALLNFGDGMIGSSLDLRLITTTNVAIEDVDPAVFRARRLCRRVEVGPLEAQQAWCVYRRLVPNAPSEQIVAKFPEGHGYTLAEIYQAAYGGGDGYQPPTPKRRAGFST